MMKIPVKPNFALVVGFLFYVLAIALDGLTTEATGIVVLFTIIGVFANVISYYHSFTDVSNEYERTKQR